MNRPPLIILILLMTVPAGPLCAQENPSVSGEDLDIILQTLKNPFMSQIPKPEEPEPEPAKPADKKPVDTKPKKPDTEQAEPPKPKKSPNVKAVPPKATQKDKKGEEEIILPEMTVTGVIWNTDRPQAIIDGYVVDEGDSLKGVSIININKQNIKAMYHGRIFNINTKRSL